jgi:hypothetical protein
LIAVFCLQNRICIALEQVHEHLAIVGLEKLVSGDLQPKVVCRPDQIRLIRVVGNTLAQFFKHVHEADPIRGLVTKTNGLVKQNE